MNAHLKAEPPQITGHPFWRGLVNPPSRWERPQNERKQEKQTFIFPYSALTGQKLVRLYKWQAGRTY